jgi:hypothetical protein
VGDEAGTCFLPWAGEYQIGFREGTTYLIPIRARGELVAWEVLENPSKGFVNAYRGGENLPGRVETWFGPGERYVDSSKAMSGVIFKGE